MKKFPLYFSHNKKAKFMVMDRALARATLEMRQSPRRRFIEIIRRSDEKLMALVVRKQHGLVIEWFKNGQKRDDVVLPRPLKKPLSRFVEQPALHVH